MGLPHFSNADFVLGKKFSCSSVAQLVERLAVGLKGMNPVRIWKDHE